MRNNKGHKIGCVYTRRGTFLGLEKEGRSDTFCNLEDITLSERSQTQDKHCDSTHRRPLEESDPQSQEVVGGARGWGQGKGTSV